MKIPESMGILCILFNLTLLSACSQQPQAKAVYMLMDTSGTYTQQLDKAQSIINYLLLTLNSGDSLAVARIDSGSFSEKDIIAKTSFDMRPSVANNQKRAFREKLNHFVGTVKASAYTDISGGTLQAIEYLNETGAKQKYILIFSDLQEELQTGHVRDFKLPMQDIQVIALNVTKLHGDIVDPREYMDRVEKWQQRIETNGGHWRVINDLERLDKLISI